MDLSDPEQISCFFKCSLDLPKRQLRRRDLFLLMTLHSGRRSEVPFWGAHERERDCFQLALDIVSCRWIHRKVLIRVMRQRADAEWSRSVIFLDLPYLVTM